VNAAAQLIQRVLREVDALGHIHRLELRY
jgi:hypothetical protein